MQQDQEVHGTILPVLKVEHAAHDVVSSADARLLAHLNNETRAKRWRRLLPERAFSCGLERGERSDRI